MRRIFKQLVFGSLLIMCLVSCSKEVAFTSVEDQNFNKDWLFVKDSFPGAEAEDFSDSNWRKLDLPHDWSIEGPFSNDNNARTGGLPVHGVGWYRKHFTIDKAHKDKQVAVEFDGAMSNAKVWLNGNYVGERPYGYIGFEFDLTPFIKYGEDNVIAVRLAPEDLSMRWYAGAGIYRNVRLKINDALHIPQWGTFVTTPEVTNERALVKIETMVKNAGELVSAAILETNILDESGVVVGTVSSQISIEKTSNNTILQEVEVLNPVRWDMNNPVLYAASSKIIVNGTVVDEFDTSFGIRTIAFDVTEGFLLNGNPVELNGVCMHHDLGPLGASVNYRAVERQMQIMQSMGVNALRTSHNPPSSEVLDVCDKLGIVVIDEAFDEWQMAKVKNGYHKHFDEWHERDLRDMIKRDRNHPSVIMWSIGNEILEQSKEDGWKLAKHLNDICHDEDNSRPTTAGFNYYPASFKNKLAYQIDVVGVNYKPAYYKEIREQNPDMIFYGSETSSLTSSRGVYDLPVNGDLIKETNQVSSYDVAYGPSWAYPPDVEFEKQAENPSSLGEFMWTGFDYLGEPTPYGGRDNSTNGYWNADWPSRSSYFAPVDLAGFPKDRFYLYQSQWTTAPMVHVLPHWNWKGREGEIIPVYAYTNCEEVELFVNGKSFGKKVKGVDTTVIPVAYNGWKKGPFTSKYRLSWDVPYTPGTIKVVAYNKGVEVASKEIHTAGSPAQIKMMADRVDIDADGNDLSFITVRVEDAEGNLCPVADNLVNFKIEGQGSLAAVGNGNAASLESFQENYRKAFNGLCLLVVKSTEKAGEIKITATSDNLKDETIVISSK